MLESERHLKMFARNLGCSLPLQIWGPNQLLSTISQLNGNFNVLYRPNESKRDIDNRASALGTTRDLIISKRLELWPACDLKLDRSFYPPSVNTAFYFIARLRRRNPIKLCQTVTICRRKVGSNMHFPRKWGPTTFRFVRFLMTSRFHGE